MARASSKKFTFKVTKPKTVKVAKSKFTKPKNLKLPKFRTPKATKEVKTPSVRSKKGY